MLVHHEEASLSEGDIDALCRIAGLQVSARTQDFGGGAQAAGSSSGTSSSVTWTPQKLSLGGSGAGLGQATKNRQNKRTAVSGSSRYGGSRGVFT